RVSRFKGITRVCVPRSLSWRESLDRVKNVGFYLVRCYLCPSFIEGDTVKGVGLRVANFHTAYGGKPSVELLRSFLNFGPAGNLLTLSNREYLELLLEDNKLDKKSFKDVIPHHVQEDPLYNLIATYLVYVRTFPDPILYLAGLKTSWQHSLKEPIIYYHRKDDTTSEKDEVVLIDRSVVEKAKNQKLSASSKVVGKRKQAAFESSERGTRTRDLISTLLEAMSACDTIREKEKEKDKAHAELEAKCNDALHDLDKNPLVLDLHADIETLQRHVDKLHGLEMERGNLKISETQLLQEIDGLKQDRVVVLVKVVSHVAMELVCSDETEATTGPHAPLEVLLSKKPQSLRSKSTPSQSKYKPSSLKVADPNS
nr:hypothetical protein [Tanacetum cinerariifolium]GEZ99636.1 hypothetical protein [Tanacetum cinerariifolium]